MRQPALALALALAALAVVDSAECPASFEPLYKSVRRLEGPRFPLTWAQAGAACRDLAPGFGLLGRDFLPMANATKALCGNQVPLGLRSTPKGDLVWDNACMRCFDVKEGVNDTYIKLQHSEERTSTPDSYQVGSLDLATRRWHLVANDTTFACAVCQRAWVMHLGQSNEISPSRPKPFHSAYTFRIANAAGGNVSVADAIPLAVLRFNQTGVALAFETLGRDAEGTLVRMSSSRETMTPGQVSRAINQTFQYDAKARRVLGEHHSTSIEMWQDTGWCPAEKFDGFNWPGTLAESTWEIRPTDLSVVTRRCVAQARADGDFDAVWEDDVGFWIDRGKECKSQPAKNILRALQQFVTQPPRNRSTTLRTLVKIMSTIPKLKWTVVDENTFYPPRSTFSQAILAALSSLLSVTKGDDILRGNYSSKSTCVFVTGDLQSTNDSYMVTFTENNAPEFLRHDMANDHTHPAIVIRVPSQLTSSGQVGLHTMEAINVRESPLFKAIHNLVVKASMAVVVHVASSIPLAAWRREGTWPVTFQVDNARSLYTYERHFSVWRLGDSEETTLPCPLTKIVGSIDTFVCNAFNSDIENFTTGTFIAYHQIDSESDLVRYIERVFLGYIGIQIDESVLHVVVHLANRMVDDAKTFKRRALTSSAIILDKASEYFEQILGGVVLTSPVVTASQSHVKVLVSSLTVTDPVVGFSLDSLAGIGAVQTVRLSKNVSAESEIDVVLGACAQGNCQQLAILAVSNVELFYPKGSLGTYLKRKLMVVNLKLTMRRGTVASPSDFYMDIQILKGRSISGALQVATWIETKSDWSVSTCFKLRSTRGAKQVFRCESPTLAGNELRGRYLVFEPSGFADALGPTLLAVLITAGILSGISLTSIAATAAALPTWRQNQGHKILLQMTLALSFNLALGFTSSFVSVDTASNLCIAVGALRHFSYLAMFAWMLVLSGLQLSRLLSFFGVRNTTNLLLKVSFIGWGLPALSVCALLAFNYKIYQSDVADRGFCYPEGYAFRWTVQAPAATVLFLNFIIFIVILARLYGLCGWGQMEELRRHQNERTFQARRLRAVFYTFLLFGIAWVFHLLAEQGVFKKKYLYEYLFLMTASMHVFLLSCIFVYFDRNTQKEWLKVSPITAVSSIFISKRESST